MFMCYMMLQKILNLENNGIDKLESFFKVCNNYNGHDSIWKLHVKINETSGICFGKVDVV